MEPAFFCDKTSSERDLAIYKDGGRRSMKKTVLTGLFLIVCVCFTFAGGGGESSGASAAKPMLWKFSTGDVETTAEAYAALTFASKIKEKSKGLITVEVYTNAQLASDKESLSLIQMGSITGSTPNTSILSSLDPAFLLLDMPYVTTSQQELIDILDKGFGEHLSNKLIKAANIRIISWAVKGPRVVYNYKQPIYRLADIKGMKLRIMENKVMSRTLELLGAIPIPLPASERVVAMQTGVVDGCENSLAVIWQTKEYEVVKYISMTNHFNTPNTVCIDSRVLESLPPDLKNLVLEAGKEAGKSACEYEAKNNSECEARLANAGLKLNTIDNLQPFSDAVKPVLDEYAPQIGKESVDLLFRLKAEVNKK